MNNIPQMQELEQFSRTFDASIKNSTNVRGISWQEKMEKQLRKTPKGRYFSKIKELAERKDSALDRLYSACKTRDEYDYCTDKLNAWYHEQRLKAHEEYFRELNKPLPTRESIFSKEAA